MIMPYVRTSAGPPRGALATASGPSCSSQSWGKLTLMCAKVAIIESAFSARPKHKTAKQRRETEIICSMPADFEQIIFVFNLISL